MFNAASGSFFWRVFLLVRLWLLLPTLAEGCGCGGLAKQKP
jgi:hypothetical protein